MPDSGPSEGNPLRFIANVVTYIEPQGGTHIGGSIEFQLTSKDPVHVREVMRIAEEKVVQEFRTGFLKEMQRAGILPRHQTKEASCGMDVTMDPHSH